MDIANTDFADHELIPVKKTLFQFDLFPDRGWGWERPIYFDRTSNVFRVLDFPSPGWAYQMDELPADGTHEYTSDRLIQYAKDRRSRKVKFKIS